MRKFFCFLGLLFVVPFLPAQTPGGTTINGIGGPFTFEGGGVSCVGYVCTFSGGGGDVTSVFGRTGDVTAESTDYTAYYLALAGGTLTGGLSFSSSGTNTISFLNSHTTLTDGISWANFGYPIGIYGGPGNGIMFKLNNFGTVSYVGINPSGLTVQDSGYIGFGDNLPAVIAPTRGSFYNPSAGVIDCNAAATDTHDCTFNAGTVNVIGSVNSSSYGQTASSSTGGTCAMAGTTSCTITLGHTYTVPVCIVTQQSATLTGGAAGCTVSGTSVTITAATLNSETWGAFVFGNPN